MSTGLIKAYAEETLVTSAFDGHAVAFSEEHGIIALSNGSSVIIHKEGAQPRHVPFESQDISTMAISQDGSYMVICTRPVVATDDIGESATKDVTVTHMFAMRVEDCEPMYLGHAKNKVASCATVHPGDDYDLVAIGFSNGSVNIYPIESSTATLDTSHGSKKKELQAPTVVPGAIQSVTGITVLSEDRIVVLYSSKLVGVVSVNSPGLPTVRTTHVPIHAVPAPDKPGVLLVATHDGFETISLAKMKRMSEFGVNGAEGSFVAATAVGDGMLMATPDCILHVPFAHIPMDARGDTYRVVAPSQEGMADPSSFNQALIASGGDAVVRVSTDRVVTVHRTHTEPPSQTFVGADPDADEFSDVAVLSRSLVAVASTTRSIQLVDPATMVSTQLKGHDAMVMSLAARAEDDGWAIASGSKDRSVRLWTVKGLTDATLAATLKGHVHAVTAVAWFHTNRALLASVSEDHTLKVWRHLGRDLEAAELTVEAHDTTIHCIAVSHDDRFIATGADVKMNQGLRDNLKVWRVDKAGLQVGKYTQLTMAGAPTILRGHKRAVISVAFHPSEPMLASAGDKEVRLWHAATGQCVATLQGHTSPVLAVRFISGGRQLVSTCMDGAVIVWSVAGREAVWRTEAHDEAIWAVDTLGDGECLATAGGLEVKLWADNTAEIERARVEKENALLEGTHEIEDAIEQGDWAAAIFTALELDHPRQCLKAIDAMVSAEEEGCLEDVLDGMQETPLAKLWSFVRMWNNRPRSAMAAQTVLAAILGKYSPKALMGVPGVADSVPAMLNESSKFFGRLDRLYGDAALIELCVGDMGGEEQEQESD
ncbi:Utp13 specific WD40 associated domain [Carpediemonas membranifera]|uniref:Utp13 specific WD40 associated domain n=1 Tax=Carpediemonas membranifera TaxID=201153 RepID=A0A8J6E141_9EUKA|nr:Utp13 specific WD40 associated domain [Carpediemonas membranifera]|eukprot:KAG9390142.1 Utp13 specific WD40 associated domain [Carpediemonas membranifera]